MGRGWKEKERKGNKQIKQAKVNLQDRDQGYVIVERVQENLKRGKCNHQFAEEEGYI